MDRLRDAFRRAVRSALSSVDYYALYRARVVSQSGQKVDLTPDDKRLPGLQNVRLRHGVPGLEVTVIPGCYVLLGWDNGDPSAPFASLWDGGESVTKLVLKATTVYLGDEAGADSFVKKTEFNAHIHQTSGVQAGAGNINSGAPTVPATGTTKVKGV